MKKYWKLFIPFYGMVYSTKVSMNDVARNYPWIFFGSAAVQGLSLSLPTIIAAIMCY